MTLADGYNEALLAAAALLEERDEARAEVERLRAALAESDRYWEEKSPGHAERFADVRAERDRLRAVLAETPENVRTVVKAWTTERRPGHEAGAVLAALRARAELEPTPTPAPSARQSLHGLWVQCQRPGCGCRCRLPLTVLDQVDSRLVPPVVTGGPHAPFAVKMIELPDGWTVGMDPEGAFYAVCPEDTEATRAPGEEPMS